MIGENMSITTSLDNINKAIETVAKGGVCRLACDNVAVIETLACVSRLVESGEATWDVQNFELHTKAKGRLFITDEGGNVLDVEVIRRVAWALGLDFLFPLLGMDAEGRTT